MTTNKSRTIESRDAFMNELFPNGSTQEANVFVEPIISLESDALAPGYGPQCLRYVREVKENSNILIEYHKFIEGI